MQASSSAIYVAGAPSTTARVWALVRSRVHANCRSYVPQGGTYGAAQPVFQVANGGWLRAEDMWGESPYSTWFSVRVLLSASR